MQDSRRKGRLNREKLKNSTRIITWNVQGKLECPLKRELLLTELRAKNAMIACIQETRWDDNAEFSLPNLGKIINIPSRTENAHRRYGIGFYISPEWERRVLGIEYINDRVAVMKLKILEKDDKPLIIVNVYGPTCMYTRQGDTAQIEEFYEDLTRTIERLRSEASILLIGGDFNSKIGQMREEDVEIMGRYTKGSRNLHGEYLAEFMKNTRMFLCNTAFKHRDHHIATWHGSHLTTRPDGTQYHKGIHNQIDYMAILQRHKGMITNSRSYQGSKYESDHSMVVTDIRFKAIYPISQQRVIREKQRDIMELCRNPDVRYNYEASIPGNIHERYINRVAAAEFMGERNIPIDDKFNILGEALKASIKQSVPLAPKKVGGRIVYINDATLKQMSERREKLWHKYRTSKIYTEKEAAFNERKLIFRAMKKRIKELNSDRINVIATELERNSANGGNRAMYEYARLMKKKEFIRFSIIDNNGYEQFSPEIILPILRDYYVEKFNQEGIEALNPWDGEPRPLTDEITMEEIDEATMKLNNHRSPGPDGFTVEMYKYAGQHTSGLLAKEFNLMFSTHEKINSLTEGILIPLNKPNAPRTPAKTRPIVLFNTVRKVFCIMLRNRVLGKMENYLSQSQHGYRPRRSTTELIWSAQWIKATVEKYKESFQVINTDMSEAFDRAKRDLLMQILERDVHFNQDELRMTRALLSGIKLQIRTGGVLGESFETKKGVPQGDGLSPHLFIIYMEHISREYKRLRSTISHKFDVKLDYADDENFFLYEPVNNLMGPCSLNCNCARCQKDEIIYLLPEVMEQSNMKMNPEKTKINTLERNGRKEISINQVGSNVNPNKELKIRINKAMNALISMSKIWLKGNPISQKTKMRLYTITVLPHLLYNIHAAPLTKAELEKLNTAQRRHLRRILGIFWPNMLAVRATYRVAKTRPISLDVIKRRWQFLGHILRGNDQAPAQKSMRIYYADRAPEAGEGNRTNARQKHKGRAFTSLPGMINEEFKLLKLDKRLELTGGNRMGIDMVTTWGDMLKFKEIANDDGEGRGVKWKRIVKEIELAAEKEWITKERRRLRAKRNARRQIRNQQPDRANEIEEPDPEEIPLYPIFIRRERRPIIRT